MVFNWFKKNTSPCKYTISNQTLKRLIEDLEIESKIMHEFNPLLRYLTERFMEASDPCLDDTSDKEHIMNIFFDHEYRCIKIEQETRLISKKISSEIEKVRETEEFKKSGKMDQTSMIHECRNIGYSAHSMNEYFDDRMFDFIANRLPHLNDVHFKKMNPLFKKIGIEGIIFLGNSFAAPMKIVKMPQGHWKYDEVALLHRNGLLLKGKGLDVGQLLTELKVAELKSLAQKNSIELKGRKKNEMIDSLKSHGDSLAHIGDYIPIRDYYSLSDELRDNFELLRDTYNMVQYYGLVLLALSEKISDLEMSWEAAWK